MLRGDALDYARHTVAGMRMRVPQSLLVGLMWFDPDRPDPLARLRHLAQERDGAPLRQPCRVFRCLSPKSPPQVLRLSVYLFQASLAVAPLVTVLSVQLLQSTCMSPLSTGIANADR